MKIILGLSVYSMCSLQVQHLVKIFNSSTESQQGVGYIVLPGISFNVRALTDVNIN